MRSIGYLDCQKKRVDFSSDKLVAYANKAKPYNYVVHNNNLIKEYIFTNMKRYHWLAKWWLQAEDNAKGINCLQKTLVKMVNIFKFLTHNCDPICKNPT